jgi:hypothetical protein
VASERQRADALDERLREAEAHHRRVLVAQDCGLPVAMLDHLSADADRA